MLTFSGTNMDVVQSPILVVNDHDYLDDTMVGNFLMLNGMVMNPTLQLLLQPYITPPPQKFIQHTWLSYRQ